MLFSSNFHFIFCYFINYITSNFFLSVFHFFSLISHLRKMAQVSLCLIGSLGGDCGLHCCLVRLLCHGTSTWVDASASLFAGITGHGRVYLSHSLEEGGNHFYVVSLSCVCKIYKPATEIFCTGALFNFCFFFQGSQFHNNGPS